MAVNHDLTDFFDNLPDNPEPGPASQLPDITPPDDVFSYLKDNPPKDNRDNPTGGNNGTQVAYYEMEPVMEPRRQWYQLDGEGNSAYEAFTVYLEVCSELAGTAQGVTETAKRLGRSAEGLYALKKKWKWVERQRAYEAYNLRLQEAEQRRAMRKAAAVWAERRLKIRERGFDIGEKLLDRAERLLSLPIANKEVKATYKDKLTGEEIPTTTILNFQSHPRDARLFIETGMKIVRLSAEMSTENVNLALEDVDLDAMSDEELEAYADKLIEMRKESSEDGRWVAS